MKGQSLLFFKTDLSLIPHPECAVLNIYINRRIGNIKSLFVTIPLDKRDLFSYMGNSAVGGPMTVEMMNTREVVSNLGINEKHVNKLRLP